MFDSSAKHFGRSLNDCLYKRPDTVNSLVCVICRFRTNEVGFIADVEKMFHAFWVPPEHRDSIGLFWWKGNQPGSKLAICRANVHVFGYCSSPARATFTQRHTTTGENAAQFPLACSYMNRNSYVDDVLGSATSPEEVIRTLTDTRTLLTGFNIRLHKIVSNRGEVIDAFPPSEVSEKVKQVELAFLPTQNTLRVAWNLAEDTISLQYQLTRRPFTKRGIFSGLSPIYYPLGIIAPILHTWRVMRGEIQRFSILENLEKKVTFKMCW